MEKTRRYENDVTSTLRGLMTDPSNDGQVIQMALSLQKASALLESIWNFLHSEQAREITDIINRHRN